MGNSRDALNHCLLMKEWVSKDLELCKQIEGRSHFPHLNIKLHFNVKYKIVLKNNNNNNALGLRFPRMNSVSLGLFRKS